MKLFVALILLHFNTLNTTIQQPTWVYKNPEVVQDLAPYNAALSVSGLDRFRYFDQRNTLHFENGLNVELLSANEVIAMGLPIKTNHVRTFAPSAYPASIFKLAPNGTLIELVAKAKAK